MWELVLGGASLFGTIAALGAWLNGRYTRRYLGAILERSIQILEQHSRALEQLGRILERIDSRLANTESRLGIEE